MMQVEILDLSNIFGLDWGMTVRTGIKSQAELYAKEEAQRIIDRTPDATGSLRADETWSANIDPQQDEIAHFWTGTANQLANGGRAYAIYVEGPPMPDGTDPLNVGGINGMWATAEWAQGYAGANMYGDAASEEDLALLEKYGDAGMQAAVDAITSGGGVRI
ncbi:hypothetical protein [Ktedonobacter robiniae]|uniref:Uncharacterized protein n=1 Tax=Ktedonobacter robiniae TaxID=2778365 RepID=A0ABQ3US27_9CHLR|nr:hypothetical protein [Ktedonobacter robiniae]GHO55524.1 hypothetical protein KSB_39990 [Ktedonobacter robiniae]